MRVRPIGRSTLRRMVVGAALVLTAGTVLTAPSQPAQATTGAISKITGQTADPYGRTEDPLVQPFNFLLGLVNPLLGFPNLGGTAAVQMTVDSPLSQSGDLAWRVTEGPDSLPVITELLNTLIGPLSPVLPSSLVPKGVCGDISNGGPNNAVPITPYTIVDNLHPFCRFGQGALPILEAYGGTDKINVWVDKDHDLAQDSDEPFITVNATFTNEPATTTTGPASTTAVQTNTCQNFFGAAGDAPNALLGLIPHPLTFSDEGGRAVPNQVLDVQITQAVPNGSAPPAKLQFCNQFAVPDVASRGVVSGRTVLNGKVTTGDRGEAAPFGVLTDALYPVTVTTYIDADGDRAVDSSEIKSSQTYNVIKGGADGVTKLVLALDNPNGFTGSPNSGTITLTNSLNQPSIGVTPSVAVSGANTITQLAVQATDQNGQARFSYTPSNAGVDTVTAYVNQSNGGTPGRDGSEPQATGTFTNSATPQNVSLAFTARGSLAGGQLAADAHTDNSGDAQHSVLPTSQVTETFTAKVTDTTNATRAPRQGVRVNFTIPTTNGRRSGGVQNSTSANDITLSTLTAVSDANGIATVTASNPAPVAGDAYRVNATVGGTGTGASAWVLYQEPTIATTPDSTNGTLGTSWPTTRGIVTATPEVVTSKVGSNQIFTGRVRDQFGTAKAGVTMFFSVVAGRNFGVEPKSAVTDSNGAASQSLQDTSQAPLSNGNRDTIAIAADVDGNAATNGDQNVVNSLRYYTSGDPLAAAVEGGFGAPTAQFATTSPYAPVTSDNNASTAIDVTRPVQNQTAKNVFFAARTADGVPLYGRFVTVESSGIGTLVNPDTNAPISGPVTATIGSDGFASVKILSTKTGEETLTATIDSVDVAIKVNWTTNGNQRNITLSPATANVQALSTTPVIATATDLYGNKVPGAPLTFTVSAPGQFADGTTTLNTVTGTDGTALIRVKNGQTGSITVTANMTGAEVGKAANDPLTGAPAGNSTATSKLTIVPTAAADTSKTTLLFQPASQVAVGQTITVTATVRDADNQIIAGKHVGFFAAGVVSAADNDLTTDNNGKAVFQINSSKSGTGTVTLKVYDANNNVEVTKVGNISYGQGGGNNGGTYPSPKLTQSNFQGTVDLNFVVDPHYNGKTVYFFRKSGMTGKVVPLGTGVVNQFGSALRSFNAKPGQILALYGKILGAADIKDPYSNLVTFKVNS